MFKLKFSIALLFLAFGSVFSQENINNYKYVVVPVQYEFQKGEDTFQVNSLTKFLFDRAGFEVYLSNDVLPEDLVKNRCLALTARVNDLSKMLSTKMNLDLLDCRNNIVYSSPEGKSKAKEYKQAYHESIREFFEEIDTLGYKYNEGSNIEGVAAVVAVENVITQNEVTNSKPKNEVKSSSQEVVPAVVVLPVVAKDPKEGEKVVAEILTESGVLYAQAVEDGYQLVDSTPKVIYILKKTNIADVYTIKDHDGIVYKKNDNWHVDIQVDGKLVTKKLNIKFF